MNSMATIRALLNARNYTQAEAQIQQDLACTTDDTQRVQLYEFLATIARENHDLSLAKDYSQQALTLAAAHSATDPVTHANVLHNLSMTLDLLQEYEAAIPYAEQEIQLLSQCLPADHPRLAQGLLSLAKHHYELGRFALAKSMVEDALKRFKQREGPRSLGVSACLNNLGRILEHTGEAEASIALFAEASAIRQELLGTHPETAFTLLNWGTALAGLGRYTEATPILMQSRDMYLELGLNESPYLQAARDNIMICWNAVCTPR